MSAKSTKRSRKSTKNEKFDKWEELPDEIKQKVVGNLDYVDRFFFALSAKSSFSIFMKTPHTIPEVRMEKLTKTKYRVLLPGTFEAVVDSSGPRKLRNVSTYHDYVLFGRQKLVRKRDSDGVLTILRKIVGRIVCNPMCTIGLLKIDDTFLSPTHFFSSITEIFPVPKSKILALKIETSESHRLHFSGSRGDQIVTLFRFLKPDLKSVICEHDLSGGVPEDWNSDEEEWDEEFVGKRESNVFDDKLWLESLEVFRFPSIIDRKIDLSAFKTRQLEVWNQFIKYDDVIAMIRRWDREDVPVGSQFKFGMKFAYLDEIFRYFDNVEEKSFSSGRIKFSNENSSESKEFFVFNEEPSKICCLVRNIC